MTSLPPTAELKQVSKTFGTQTALRKLTLTLTPGTITLVLGENGAGKSTLLRLLAGLSTPTQGTLQVFGASPQQSRHRIAYMSHAPMLYDELTAIENLQYFAKLAETGMACACASGSPEMALRAVGLDPNLTRPIAQYSQGMRQRASLARVLQSDPEFLLLDEPFSNLDVAGAQQMVEMLADFRTWPGKEYPRTIVLTTHQAHLATAIADRTLTITRGMLLESPATPSLHGEAKSKASAVPQHP